METVTHNVRDLNGAERSAVERLVGHELNESQQLVIQVVSPDVTRAENGSSTDPEQLLPWDNFYEGLSDEEIDAIERSISRRLDLTRRPAME